VALYEPDAVLAFPPGQVTTGRHAIRQAYERLLADGQRSRQGNSSLRSTMATWHSPRRVWSVVEQRLRWPGASQMAPGVG
jgi:hypothetical protein